MDPIKYDNKVFKHHLDVRAELAVLFEEAVDFSNRLKKQARKTHRGDHLSASGRMLMQSLQLHGPQTVPALAHIRSTSRQNIQVLVNRLAGAGYVQFTSNPGHKRSGFVALTEAGSAMLESAGERESGLIDMLLPHASVAEVRAAAGLLHSLRQIMGPERKRRTPARHTKPEHPTFTQPPAAQEQAWSAEEMPVSLL